MKGNAVLKAFCLFALLWSVASCEQFSRSIKDTLKNKEEDGQKTVNRNTHETDAGEKIGSGKKDTEEPKVKEPPLPLTGDPEALKEAEESLRNLPEFRGKTIYVHRIIYFYDDGRIHLQIQNPDNPEYADMYRYGDGQWQDAQPVRLSA
ncbi:hypothetical protein [Sinomicrobium weinanense]|nr:hypothetical protein [Sinomicrobium weinanense]MBU3122396.1 hypothetical protein [Sinomicrobium weinanense]